MMYECWWPAMLLCLVINGILCSISKKNLDTCCDVDNEIVMTPPPVLVHGFRTFYHTICECICVCMCIYIILGVSIELTVKQVPKIVSKLGFRDKRLTGLK
jgi:hypothetical protein